MERLSQNEIKDIINKLKKENRYNEYFEMINDDFEEHNIVYTLDSDEIIALAVKNNTVPFALKEFYNWQEMSLLIEEEDYL